MSTGVCLAGTLPFILSTIHLMTRELSLKPGHMNFPSPSFLNQLTKNIFGG